MHRKHVDLASRPNRVAQQIRHVFGLLTFALRNQFGLEDVDTGIDEEFLHRLFNDILNLQTIVSRQISPFDPAVVTVGSIHGGTQHNVIPDRVDLQLTVRSYKPEVREQLLAAIKRTAIETARSAGFPDELLPQTSIRDRYTPANYNDPDLLDRLAAIWSEALGDDAIEWVEPVMAGEDFARYGMSAEIPTVLFWLGAVDPARIRAARQRGEVLPSLHSSGFAPLPGPAIRTGVEAMTSAVLDLMAP